jgi:carboxyl-terminal processing protease
LTSKDSIKFADSLKFKTPKGKVVYGGGGIMPDIFIPIDTSKSSNYLTQLFIAGIINQFAVNYSDKNRSMLAAFSNYERYEKEFNVDDRLFNELLHFADQEKIKRNEKDIQKSAKTIKNQLKAYIARCTWRSDAFYKILSNEDKVMQEAIKALQ